MQRFVQQVVQVLAGRQVRRGLLVLGVLGVLAWVVFFDSHNLVYRFHMQQDLERLQQENASLEERLRHLEIDLQYVEDDETVERVAREQYDMRREGETIYRTRKVDPQAQ